MESSAPFPQNVTVPARPFSGGCAGGVVLVVGCTDGCVSCAVVEVAGVVGGGAGGGGDASAGAGAGAGAGADAGAGAGAGVGIGAGSGADWSATLVRKALIVPWRCSVARGGGGGVEV